MKNFRRLLILSTLLAILALGLILASCTGGGNPTDTTNGATVADPPAESDTAPVESATTPAETETELIGLRLEPDKGVLVLSPYATEWEKTAADTLSERLGITARITDTEVSDAAWRLVVGYTALNAELDYADGHLGGAGYLARVIGNTLHVAADNAGCMEQALAALEAVLVTGADGYPVYPANATVYEPLTPEPAETPSFLGAWGDTITYAQQLQNGVQTHYTDPGRTKWRLSNQNVILYCNLAANGASGHKNLYDAITNANGIPYLINTGALYLTDAEGKVHSSWDANNNSASNMYEMGYYYNNIHIKHLGYAPRSRTLDGLDSETVLHMYSDKLNIVQHIIAAKSGSGLSGYGQTFELDAGRVLGLRIKDAGGVHDTLDSVDMATVEYVAFDMERAGVIGFILLPHETAGRLTVTLADGVYTVDQFMTHDPAATFDTSTNLYLGLRLYTTEAHAFEGFLAEAEAERNPLKIAENGTGAFEGYDALRGAYKINMPVVGWGSYENPNGYSVARVSLTGDSRNRRFYLYSDCHFGALECAVMLDESKTVLPVALEITKNFNGENEEPTFDRGDMHYGRTYLPFTLEAGEEKTFSLLGLNMNWGKTPLKQLSSIQFFSPYYHLSLGPHETNCISPDGVNGKNYWFLPDFRPVGSGLSYDGLQFWANSEIRLLQYEDKDGIKGEVENCYDHIDSYGPLYADVTTGYRSADDRLEVTYRHVELPGTDENRTLYSVRIDIREDITFADFYKDFLLFSFNGRNLQYGTATYLNEANEVTYETILPGEIKNGVDPVTGKRFKHDQYIKLGTGEATYFGYFNALNFDQYFHPNFAMMIKDRDIRIGGEAFEGSFLVRDYFTNNMTHADLTLDIKGEITLRAGDYIYFDIILLPWGRQYDGDRTDPAENDDSIQKVRADSVMNPFAITAEAGTVIPDTYVPKVRVDDTHTATFTVTGGASNGVVRVYGLRDYTGFTIEEVTPDGTVPYSNASALKFDGYTVYADGDGTYSIIFAFDMTEAGTSGRTFTVRAGS